MGGKLNWKYQNYINFHIQESDQIELSRKDVDPIRKS